MLRRLAALLSIVALVQLALAGNGVACDGHDVTASSMESTKGSGLMAHGPAASSEAHGSPADAVPLPDECAQPWSPGSCASMAGCVANALPYASILAAAPPRVLEHALPAAPQAPPSPVRAPELPPPRA